MNAILYKMKADYLRYIFECLSGDDGLLNSEVFQQEEMFLDDAQTRFDNEISSDDIVIDCEICNPNKGGKNTLGFNP